MLCAVVATAFGIVWTVRTGEPHWLFLSLPFTLMLFVLARLAPVAYRLAGDGVHVERKFGDRVIPYRDIVAVDRESRRVRGLSMFASDGLFGRFGTFWNPRLGFYQLFLTNTDTVVWLGTRRGWIGLSPDRPDEFLERLRARLGVTR